MSTYCPHNDYSFESMLLGKKKNAKLINVLKNVQLYQVECKHVLTKNTSKTSILLNLGKQNIPT